MAPDPATMLSTFIKRASPAVSAQDDAFIANDKLQASIVWGFSLGFGLLTAVKAVQQTRKVLHRTGPSGNTYIWLVWGLLVANFCGGVLVWLGIYGTIKPSVQYFFFVLCTWIPQVQFIPQIIINRISLLLYSQREVRWLKFIVALIITLVNISVFCIWIPARLQVSPTYVHINNIWDRIEKCIFLVVDASLNSLFIYLVRTRLVALGLMRYKPLFYFNLCIIAVSLSLDVLLIGMMSLPNAFVYAQFHPLVYTIKLNIEMSMADLIIKIVKSSQEGHSRGGHWQDYTLQQEKTDASGVGGRLDPAVTTTTTLNDEDHISQRRPSRLALLNLPGHHHHHQQQQQQQQQKQKQQQQQQGRQRRRNSSKTDADASKYKADNGKTNNDDDDDDDDGVVWHDSAIRNQAEAIMAERRKNNDCIVNVAPQKRDEEC